VEILIPFDFKSCSIPGNLDGCMDAISEALFDLDSGSCLEQEGLLSEGLGLLGHPGWSARFPWLLQGVTTRQQGQTGSEEGFDLGLRGSGAAGVVLQRWDEIQRQSGMQTVVHARQVHGSAVRVHGPLSPGLLLSPDADGHATREPRVLLAVSLADCIPVFLVAPETRAICLLHAGWRGTAAGILEEGIARMQDAFGAPPGALVLHLGPGIAAASYEVGPEVHEAVGLQRPLGPTPLNLRRVLADRALKCGVPQDAITWSLRDTRTDPLLFSHRGGDSGRHLALLGVRERPAGRSP
jgi:polyphenol oxidase